MILPMMTAISIPSLKYQILFIFFCLSMTLLYKRVWRPYTVATHTSTSPGMHCSISSDFSW